MTIWKFPLALVPHQAIAMPEGAQVLTVQMQRGSIMLWALVDPTARLKERVFHIVRTGTYDAPDTAGEYIGTVQKNGTDGYDYVWHVFGRR